MWVGAKLMCSRLSNLSAEKAAIVELAIVCVHYRPNIMRTVLFNELSPSYRMIEQAPRQPRENVS